ncbi:MAG: PEPxxWA-CTERM sorting domain-containing protein [Alphaproteobacteria bacterium]|nr:PEPxxWA-CTERM sorting domain-containing protein [Alphaproteobacteria bacterium]MBU1515484.1 PEPxxWA-CTERM sorting domain-containing protein [Alphaproteobacteria bacterium]MBU2095482.1 PEPxxWA-CTERM sorting domain-containing protein [Alphaproteobacteria bacterium]MBU2150723.1 PEPxxWA-CTERM sorting domain-containing protein [Alphaproteobacteria bacterium]MBU2306988.1 PEPxxWA-CTERM sorting domain-containing protein [Alphaproteobacteria bacterium]
MRLKGLSLACAAAAAMGLSVTAAQAATFANGSFEAALTGWTANSDFIVTPSIYNHDDHADGFTPYDPIEGVSFATLMADQPDAPVTLRQTFTTMGGLFSGWAAFSANDIVGYNDSSFVKVFNDSTTIVLFAKNVNLVGSYGQTGWTQFSTALTAGTWTVEAGVLNDQDALSGSHLLLDNFAMAEAPEPATWALMLIGFFGLGGAIRRRRAIAA